MTTNLYWVCGLREPSGAYQDWRKRTLELFLSNFAAWPSLPKTSDTESGLNIPASRYWYVMHSEKMFGYIVFLFHPNKKKLVAPNGGICPFDTGGLWGGKILTKPPSVKETEKQDFFKKHDSPLSSWPDAFSAYIGKNYSDISEYVLGKKPSLGIPEIIAETTNTSQAWTWEARIEKRKVRGRVSVRRIFWKRLVMNNFMEWLKDENFLGLPLSVRTKILKAICHRSRAGITPYSEATAYLLANISNKAGK